MKVTGSAVSLTVADPETSASFLEQTFGFEREMAAEGFVSLRRPDVDFNIIYLRAGLPTFRPRDRAAGGEILTPIQTEEWGRAVLPGRRSQRGDRTAGAVGHDGPYQRQGLIDY